jgi:PAS domain S-box-containing protein
MLVYEGVGGSGRWRGFTLLVSALLLSGALLVLVIRIGGTTLLGVSSLACLCGGVSFALLWRREPRWQVQERKLKDETRYSDDIIAAIPSGRICLDRSGNICRWNAGATKILGLGRGGILGHHVRNWPLEGQTELVSLLKDALEGRTINRASFDVVRSDGRSIPLGISTSLLGAADEADAGVVAIFQDLTEVKKIQGQMKKQERLAAIGTLAASIAHEIRNPLASIAGSVEVIAGELDLKGDMGELLDLIIKESDRLNNLITDFLDFTRDQSPVLSSVNPEALTREILRGVKLSPEADEGLELILEAEDAPETVSADPAMLKQVFLNLIINACQAMKWKGVLRVSIGQEVRDGGKMVNWHFRDTGPGVPDEVGQHMFEPFYTTRTKGTGLGLAIAHRFAEVHDGHLELVTGLVAGADLLFTIPLRGDREPSETIGTMEILGKTPV